MKKKLYKISELSDDIQEEIIDSCIRDDERIRDYVKDVLLKDCKFLKDGYLINNGFGK